jgi:hypothetical protein
MRNKTIYISMFGFLLFTSLLYAQTDNITVSIALIADKAGSLDKSPLMSLLEARLSQNGNIKLLERAQIDKILQEQQLSAAGLLDRTNSIKIGQLLRVDAFVIITTETPVQSTTPTANASTGTLIRVRVVQTSHGLRLLDCFEQLEESKLLNDIAQTITKRVTAVTKKLLLPAGQVIPVGIVDIHRVQLGEQYRILERTLPVLLSVKLGIEPKIIMLEREDLKILQDEKLRTQGEDSKFWASAVLIEGNLQPKDGDLIMSLSLRRPAGQATKSFTISVEPNEPSTAIDKAATNIVQEILNTPPSTQWQLAAEAEQFYQQGQLLSNHLRFEEATNLFETAHALEPDNVFYTGAVFSCEWTVRTENVMFRPIDWRGISISSNRGGISVFSSRVNRASYYTDLELAELASILIRQIRDDVDKSKISAADIRDRFSSYLGAEKQSNGYYSNYDSIATEQIMQINRVNRKIWVETYSNALKKQIIRRDNPRMNDLLRARLAWVSSDDPNELRANLKKTFIEFVMPPELGGQIKSASDRTYFDEQVFGSLTCFSSEYLKELTTVKDTLISAESKKALLQISPDLSNQVEDTQGKSAAYREAKILLEKLKNLDPSQNGRTKQQLLTQIRTHTGGIRNRGGGNFTLPPIDEQVELWEQMCNLLIEQKDITNLAFLNPGHNFLIPYLNPLEPNLNRQQFLRFNSLLVRISKVFQTRPNDQQVIFALNAVKDFQAEIKKYYPEINTTQETASSRNIKMLVTQKDWFRDIPTSVGSFKSTGPNGEITWSERSSKILLQDENLWVVFQTGGTTSSINNQGTVEWPVGIGFVGINLAQNKVFALWQTQIISHDVVREITDLSVTDKASYVSLLNAGILELPGKLKEGRGYLENTKIFTQADSLPSLSVTSMVHAGKKLWTSYGDIGQESGLGIYDPTTEKWETIFCSTLKGESLFSRGRPYVIHSMQMVSPEEMFFFVYDPTIPRDESSQNPEGLWKMNIRTQETKYFGPLHTDRADRINVEYKNQQLFFYSWYFILRMEPDSERLVQVAGNIQYLQQRYFNRNMSLKLAQELFLSDSFSNNVKLGPYYSQGNLDLSTSAIHNNKLWARLGQSQIIIAEKDKSYEQAKIIDNNLLEGEPVERFVSTPYGLIGIGKGTVGLIETGD